MGRSTAVVAGPVDGSWIILDEPELHLHGDVLVPDIAGRRRERMPALPQASAFELAPDWVCEVLSPSTASVDRTEKLPIALPTSPGRVLRMSRVGTTAEPCAPANGRDVSFRARAGPSRVDAASVVAPSVE